MSDIELLFEFVKRAYNNSELAKHFHTSIEEVTSFEARYETVGGERIQTVECNYITPEGLKRKLKCDGIWLFHAIQGRWSTSNES